eukprot:Phypoly_transcript_02472.p1 GENE.Phypoly_transcript_02472~~Phypoly_transcript_02472.p1  ORF type:complete len:865 (+),score=177.24 Phypoly_transcript_02472:169-2763(+)
MDTKLYLCLLFLFISFSWGLQHKEAFQLVRPDSTHTKLEVVPESLDLLKTLSQKVVVISALGPYHSGKSFLLNQIMDEQHGFALGPTVAPETKGIWARIAFSGDNAIIFLDTEGFFGQGASEAYDAKIFAVTTLMSSKLLFNSVKTIDQSSMDYLELLARRALMFSLKASVKEHHHSYFSFPSLTWVVRDFISELPASYESPTAWIQHLLSVRKRESVSLNGDEEESMTNEELNKIFSSVDCHTLSVPTSHPEKLTQLDTVPLAELDARFKAEVLTLKAKLYAHLERKKFDDKELNGVGLAELLNTLVELANTGIFPKVPGVWEGFIRIESQTALGDCVEGFRKKIQSLINGTLPVPEGELLQIFEDEQALSLDLLRAMLLGLTEVQNKVAEQLKTELGKLRERFQDENVRNIQQYCMAQRDAQELALDARAAELHFPVSPVELKKTTRAMSDKAQKDYKSHVLPFSNSPSCAPAAASLSKHIEKLLATLEASNLAALRKACAEAKTTAVQHFSRLVSTFTLPLAPSYVKSECNIGVDSALNEFDTLTGAFRDTDAQKETRKELEQELALRRENMILANNKVIEEKVLNVSRQIVASKSKKYADNQLKTMSQMKAQVEKFTKEALAQFEESASYARESNSYSAWTLQFTNDVKAAADKLVEANKEAAKEFFAKETEALLAALRMRFRGVVIPIEDAEIEAQIDSHTTTAKRDREERLKQYESANPEAYQMSLLEFNNEIQRQANKLRKDNVNELLQLCKIPLERSEERIKEVYYSSWLQFLFEREAYRILEEELSEKIKSQKLLHSAIQTYMEETLPQKFPFNTMFNYLKIFAFLVTVVFALALGGSFLNARKQSKIPSLKKHN